MPEALQPENETNRLAALKEYCVLDSFAESGFDELTQLAATICDVPVALISLLDENRQWFKSAFGLNVRQTDRKSAICAHTILRQQPLVVRDALTDPLTYDNRLVINDPFIRFYAGVPLRTDEGYALGSLCVIDTRPRDLSSTQLDALDKLANQAIAQLELRRSRKRLEQLSQQLIAKHEIKLHHAARELHEETGQLLTALKMKMNGIRKAVCDIDDTVVVRLEEAIKMTDIAIDQVRNLSLEMRPPHLDSLGLVATLHWYLNHQANLAGFQWFLLTSPDDLQVPIELATVCYRISQEIVTNALKYSCPRTIKIELKLIDEIL